MEPLRSTYTLIAGWHNKLFLSTPQALKFQTSNLLAVYKSVYKHHYRNGKDGQLSAVYLQSSLYLRYSYHLTACILPLGRRVIFVSRTLIVLTKPSSLSQAQAQNCLVLITHPPLTHFNNCLLIYSRRLSGTQHSPCPLQSLGS